MSRIAEIIQYPDLPNMTSTGRFEGVVATLVGGRQCSWQSQAIDRLKYRCDAIIRTDYDLPSGDHRRWMDAVIEGAGAAVVWCGNQTEVLYLDEWLWAIHASRRNRPCIFGMPREVDHPMAEALSWLMSNQARRRMFTLDETITAALELCRSLGQHERIR